MVLIGLLLVIDAYGLYLYWRMGLLFDQGSGATGEEIPDLWGVDDETYLQ